MKQNFFQSLARLLIVGWLLSAGWVSRAQYDYTWLPFWFNASPAPANVQAYGNAVLGGGGWSIQLVDNVDGQSGTMIASRPAGIPAEKYTYFNAAFDFLLINGDGADGVSFSYGPVVSGNTGGGEVGLGTGLAVGFSVHRNGNNNGRVTIRYNGQILASEAFDLWDAAWANQYLRAYITYSASGLTVRVESVNHTPGFVKSFIVPAQNRQIAGWAPASDWRFVMGGRTGADNLEAFVNFHGITVSSSPPSFTSVPASISLNEDAIASYSDVLISDFEDVFATTVTAVSSNPALIPNSGIVVYNYGSYRVLELRPSPNANGVLNVTLTATQAGQSVQWTIPVTIQPVNDAPVLTVAAQTLAEDTTLTTSVSFVDIDNSANQVSVTATASSNPTLLPVSGVQVSGTGTTRTMTIAPAPNQFGTSTVTLVANDGAGGSDTKTFVVTVNPVNDLPIGGASSALAFNGSVGGGTPGAAVSTGIGLATGNTSHTIETWINPLSLPTAREWILHLGASGTGHHWLLGTDGSIQFGAWGGNSQVSGVPLPIGKWTHVAAVWDAPTSTYSVYFNGTKIGQAAGTGFNISQANLALGQSFSGLERSFHGMMDEVRVWSRALSEGEILSGMNRPMSGTESGLVLYLPFEEGAGRTAYDRSAAGGLVHAAITGDAFYAPRTQQGQNGLLAEYYSNSDLTGLKAIRLDPTVDFNSGSGFHSSQPADNFSVRWRGSVLAPNTGDYTFRTTTDGGVRLWVNGQLVINNWTVHATVVDVSAPIALTAGQAYDILLEYVDTTATSIMTLSWTPPGLGSAVIPSANLFPIWADQDRISGFGAAAISEDMAGSIYIPGFDVEKILSQAGGDPITFTIVSLPAHGALRAGNTVLTVGSSISLTNELLNPLVFTPSTGYNGQDSFTYRLVDGNGGQSSVVRVPIMVEPQNDPPTLSLIANRTIEEGSNTGAIQFVVGDALDETPPGELLVTAVTQRESRLVTAGGIVLGGSGANRTITVTPAAGQIGTVTIEVTVKDRASIPLSSTRSFKLRVDPKPAYALLDLGDLKDLNLSFGHGVNDQGWAVGGAQKQENDGHAFVNRGFSGTGVAEDLNALYKATAYGIGPDNAIVGFYRPTPTGKRSAFLWQNGELAGLDSRLLGNDQVAYGLNSSHDIVGSFNKLPGDLRRPFLLPGTGSMVELPLLAGFDSTGEALAINESGVAVGYTETANGRSRGVVWTTGAATIGVLPDHDFSRAHDINDDGLVVGYSAASKDPNSVRRAVVYDGSALVNLGTLDGGSYSVAWAINNFGQVVGDADQGTAPRAFLHTAGQMRELDSLIHDSRDFVFSKSGWSLRTARAINTDGVVVGTGVKGFNARAYMAIPAWVIGRPIAQPELAVDRFPDIEVLDTQSGATKENSFFWSDFEKKLYPLRPVTARIKWYTSFQDTTGTGTNIQVNAERIVREGISVWPKDPVIHVANAPVEIEPKGVTPFNYAYQTLMYQTTEGLASVDPTTKIFNASDNNYTVVYYLETRGFPPNPSGQRPYFEVVKTVRWNDPAHLKLRQALVGEKLRDRAEDNPPGHQDYLGKNGYVFFENSYYDGSGPDRAYDRATRQGPIIPVNLDRSTSATDDMVVVWYRFSRIGVAWASVPVQYGVSWPSDETVDRIVIASGQGSGGLPSSYKNMRPYVQANSSLPGYNLNEEHAMMAPANKGEGQALFALRNDLNGALQPKVSEPYALLKYQDGDAADEWSIRVYKVLAEDSTNRFRFTGVAGVPIQPPYPLSLLPLCSASYGSEGPWWEDWKGTLYARGAGAFGQPTDIRVRWFYPMQPGFYHPAIEGVTPTVGSCLAWLDQREANALSAPNQTAGTKGDPIDVTYTVKWPDAPTLQVGETLTDSKNGLPAVRNMASLKMIYDDLSPSWNPLDLTQTAPAESLARLYDPLSEREYQLKQGEQIPSTIKRSNRGGKEYFDDLGPSLQDRLYFDPVNRWLLFKGILDKGNGGDPLLLPNVMTTRERDAVKKLAASSTAWADMVDALFRKTRNPNEVKLTNDVAGSAPLRIGLKLVGDKVVPESLGSQPKALTAALAGVPPAVPRPIKALDLGGVNEWVDAGSMDLGGKSFTIEFWAKRDTSTDADYVVGLGTGEPNSQLIVGWDAAGRFVFRFSATDEAYGVATTATFNETGEWHHWAVVFDANTLKQRIYRDGVLVAEETSLTACQAVGRLLLGRRVNNGAPGSNELFGGQLEEFRVWNRARTGAELAVDRFKGLTGYEGDLARYYRFDQLSGIALVDDGPDHVEAVPVGSLTLVDSTAPTGIPPRYMVLAENDDSALAGFTIKLHIIRVDDGPYPGDLKILYPGNVFDQRLTLRHSSEFGGDPDPIRFEWYYKPDDAGTDPRSLPTVNPDGSIADIRGWIPYTNVRPQTGFGVNDVTIGEAGESGLLTLGDNWFICRIRGYNIRGVEEWSGWIGDPSGGGTPKAQLAEGWVKRVIRGLNPFDARTADFHSNASATYTSMILQAGQRYEGDIAFNPSGENLNALGLIEAYTTVLNRGKSLSIEGLPPVNFNPANNALLLAAARVADLYVLLGHEAYSDAQDPTIGFTSSEAPYNAVASSIFSFQNQLDSPIEEELALLRGRDDTHVGVGAPPVYNRLYWNFTLGEGEIAYQQNYNINDVNFDGFITEKDARTLYPQGHGDAWGHYLTALTTYYQLLRHPQFTWIPRTEPVVVAGVPVEVDFQDERKFAQAAVARARAGKEIVELTYREQYVDDPEGQWQGYKDSNVDRAWGVAEWGWRAGQAAYFDWLTSNAILPSTDPNISHVGIQKIDRQTVSDIDQIISQFDAIQAIMDQADAGLNPLGLVKGAMQFDLDPTFLAVGSTAAIGRQAVQGLSHFEQLNERAIKALKNAQRVWDEANTQSQNLRSNQDTVDDFARNARDEERNFRNQLIEIFGYPYAGDIGPGKTYPSGYTGPDLYHYMYMPVTEITGVTVPPSSDFKAFFTQVNLGLLGNSHFPTEEKKFFTEYTIADTDPLKLEVTYPQANGGPWAYSVPPGWGARRAPGRVQEAISDVLQATARLKFAGQNYDSLIADINDRMTLLKARFNVNANEIALLNGQKNQLVEMNKAIASMKAVSVVVNRLAVLQRNLADAVGESLPMVVGLATDVTSAARGALLGVNAALDFAAQITTDGLDIAQNSVELAKEEVALTTEINLVVNSQSYDVLQQVKELEALVRNEINLRLEVFEQQEVLRQSYGRLLSTVAEGQRVLEDLVTFRKDVAAETTEYRYRDMAFRIFRNEALQKYRATFDLAARYVYICATAYDFESNFLGSDRRSAGRFFEDIIRQRQLGVLVDGEPIPGHTGLADIQGRMIQNWEILEPQFGLNNPQLETGRFSLRNELFRLRDDNPDRLDDPSDETWRAALRKAVVPNIWNVPEFRRYCRPFALETPDKPQPALVIRFPTTIQFGQNYFGKPLGGGDSAFDPTFYSTKINAVGIAFPGYDDAGLSRTPRVYLIPVGQDVMRSPTGNTQATRQWRVMDQAVPVPFAIGANDFANPSWIPSQDSLSESYGQPRRFAALRAFTGNEDIDEAEITTSTRLVARSVWNTEWMLIIPGGTLLNDPEQGLDRFIRSLGDIRLLMMVYSFAGQ